MCTSVRAVTVAWVEFEHFPEPPKGKAKRFRLAPQKFTATITFNVVEGLTAKSNFKVGNATVTQIPVNSNIATTGHKLQGMTKDALVVNECDYKCANWVYVVLSRVRTSKGLFLTKPLDLDREFNVPQSLIDFENRIRTKSNQPSTNLFKMGPTALEELAMQNKKSLQIIQIYYAYFYPLPTSHFMHDGRNMSTILSFTNETRNTQFMKIGIS